MLLWRRCWTSSTTSRLARQLFALSSHPAAPLGRKPRQQLLPAVAALHGSSAAAGSDGPGQPRQQQLPAPSKELQPEAAGSLQVTARELAGKGKLRLDAYIAGHLPQVSRAKISASIKAGLVAVNGRPVAKPSAAVKAGDAIDVALLPPEPCTAIPEAIPLNVVFEDDHLIVVNKAPGMVVHLSPGHATGTLVNALLAHCGLPACEAIPSGSDSGGLMPSTSLGGDGGALGSGSASGSGSTSGVLVGGIIGGLLEEDDLDEAEEEDEQEAADGQGLAAGAVLAPVASPPSSIGANGGTSSSSITTTTTTSSSTGGSSSAGPSSAAPGILRPGIVHRLDRGTSGLMVVAKTDAAHAALAAQFKAHSVSRIYNAITLGAPSPPHARVATNIVRDPGNRLRMMAVPYGSGRGRTAASNYQTLQVVAGGGAALVQWKLESGRTHQIRVHARHVGHPLLGDDMYGPSPAAAARQVVGKRSSLAVAARAALEAFGRPALHAKTLGFTHPATGQRLEFDSNLPDDFVCLYRQLQEWG